MNEALLCAAGLRVDIGGKAVCAALDFTVRHGERWAILGLNGVGKTTLLLTLAGLRAPSSGEVRVLDRPLAQWRGRELARVRGLMPQDTVDTFPFTALEAVLAGRYPYHSGWELADGHDRDLARSALHRVGLERFASRDCATLSGGERRRVALAALLTQQPSLFLLDEPTHHLDPHHQIALLDLLAAECSGGKAAVMTLHDPNLAARYCSHALLLFGGGGEVVAGPSPAVLTADGLSRLYGHPMHLIESAEGRCFLPR